MKKQKKESKEIKKRLKEVEKYTEKSLRGLAKFPLTIGRVMYVDCNASEEVFNNAKKELLDAIVKDVREIIEDRTDEFIIVKEVGAEDESYLCEPHAISLGAKITFPTICL